MDRKMRVLVITHAPWRNDTSVGNSYSNIFADMDNHIEFAQLYIRDGMPENNLVHEYFYISEKKLLKSIFNRYEVGEHFKLDNPMDTSPVSFSNTYNKIRSLRWNIFLIGRDIASSLGKWKSDELNRFLDDFKPDIVFGTLGFIPVVNQLMVYSAKRTGAVLIPYPWDDWFHINKNYISPIYYIRILIERHYIRKTVKNSSFLYTITEQMRDEYSSIFQKKCKVLRKGYKFENHPIRKSLDLKEVKLVYAGNIGDKRWEILSAIALSIAKINKIRLKRFHLYVYTLSPVTNKMRRALDVAGASSLIGAVSSKEIPAIMEDADILVHVEPLDKIKLENCRLSFSTKIVDYFYQGKCILAVGGQNASMKYLEDNDAALVIDNLDKIDVVLEKLASNPNLVIEYSQKAWSCGVRNHNIRKIQGMILSDFEHAIKYEEV